MEERCGWPGLSYGTRVKFRPRVRERRLRATADRERWGVIVLCLVLVVYAVWRLPLGSDNADGAHVVALALRLARGDRPLVEEMNLQAFGALPAVPFVWVWDTLVGSTALVLASRVWFVVLVAVVGVVVYRALRIGFEPLICAASAAAALVGTPYNLWVVSYSSLPVSCLVAATAAGYAACRTGRARWGVATGAFAAASGAAHAVSAAAGMALLVVVGLVLLSLGRRRALVGLIGGVVLVAGPVVLWLLLVPGVEGVRETLAYTIDYQANRASPTERFASFVWLHVSFGSTLAAVPALLLAALAAAPGPPRVRALAAVALPPATLLVMVPALLAREVSQDGAAAGVSLLLFVLAALPAVLVVARKHRDRDLVLLLIPALAVLVVGLPSLVATSSAHSTHAPGMAAWAPLTMVCVLGLGRLANRSPTWGRWGRATVAGLVVGSVLTLHSLTVFRGSLPQETHVLIGSGPAAGLRGTPCEADGGHQRQAAAALLPQDASRLIFGSPGDYLHGSGPMDTNILWLSAFGAANQQTVDWIERSGRRPEVVLVNTYTVVNNHGWAHLVATDPLVAWVDSGYPEPVHAPPFLVFGVSGATPTDPSAMTRDMVAEHAPASCGGPDAHAVPSTRATERRRRRWACSTVRSDSGVSSARHRPEATASSSVAASATSSASIAPSATARPSHSRIISSVWVSARARKRAAPGRASGPTAVV